jgi:hypothetical protein
MDLPTVVSLPSAVIIFMKNAYLEEVPEICTSDTFTIACYSWSVST